LLLLLGADEQIFGVNEQISVSQSEQEAEKTYSEVIRTASQCLAL
jgi:hypothetical protein